jgi:hypothetical protein
MKRLAMVILWPSFLVAIVEEGFFFSLFDPHELAVVSNHIDFSPKAAYTIGFFCFWVFSALAGLLTYYLASTPSDITGTKL